MKKETTEKKILIVDDQQENILMIGSLLRQNGFDVDMARSGKEALEMVSKVKPDIILLDIMMPEMDGFETCIRLKKDPSTQNIPVIFLSGLSETLNKVHGFSIGAVDYVTKPIEVDELLARINTHLTIQSLTAKLERANKELEKKVRMRTRELAKRNEELRRSEQQYRDLQNNVPVGVFRTTAPGEFLSVNAALLKILGYDSIEDLNTIKVGDAYKNPEDRVKYLEEINKKGYSIGYEVQLKRKNGDIIWGSLSSRAVYNKNKKIEYYDGILEDVSLRRQAQQDLIEAKEKAEESDRLKTTFLATITHELRTPLNAIIGFSDLLEEEELNEDAGEFANVINTSGRHLLNIIEEILNISLIESNEIIVNKETFKLDEVLEELKSQAADEKAARYKDDLRISKVTPEEHEDIFLDTDRYKLKQILLILLNNAIKFTLEGSIEYGYKIEKDKRVTFFVRDTGVGIPKDKQAIIFEKFRQADDTDTRKYGGLGVGLSIAKQLASLINTNLSVESEEGKGSTFYFSLPYTIDTVIPKEIKVEDVEKKEVNFTGRVVLIAEDEKSNFQVLQSILYKTGIKIIWAKNGREAIEACMKNLDLDLILMDLKMPVMDGYTATEAIKKIRPDLPVIVQTAYSLPGDREKAKTLGINDFITKPIDYKLLLNLMSKYLNGKPH